MKAYTDIEQSKILAEILPIESADMHYVLIDTDKNKYSAGLEKYIGILPHYPCWSLAALRACLPSGISIDDILYVFESHKTFDNEWVYEYKFEDISAPLYSKSTNEIDACYEIILKLHELKLL